MIHEIGVELAAQFKLKLVPFDVKDGPEFIKTGTFSRERVVIEHDPNGDSFTNRHITNVNPRTRLTRLIGVKITIYAQCPNKGAIYWEHKRRAESVLDQVLIGIDVLVKQRKNQVAFKSGKFIQPDDFKEGETPGGAVYELLLSIDRGISDAKWDGTAQPTATITDVAPQTGSGVVISNTTTASDATRTEPVG